MIRVNLEKNKFLSMPQEFQEEVDPDFDNANFVKQKNLAY